MKTMFDRLMAATAADFQQQLLEHPLATALMQGRIGRGHYLAWLRETWQLVQHTPGIFSLAASTVDVGQRGLRRWFLEQADEEDGHDLLCVRDVERMGLAPGAVLAGLPGAGVWGLVTQDWYLAARQPIALLGSTSVSEELGATVAGPVLDALKAIAAIPHESQGFIRAHGSQDRKHFDDVREAIDEFVDEASLDRVVHARRMAIAHCSRLLTDVLARPLAI